ncbi:MAG: hypothetical protein ACI36Y_02735 [Coriobacteriales bacterium]
MVVTIWWAPEGERHGAFESYATYGEGEELTVHEVSWLYWETHDVFGLAVQKHATHKTGEEVDEYGNKMNLWSDTRLIDDYWSIEAFMAPHASDTREEYMAWADDNVDVVAIDGSVFFRSSRLDK